MKRISSLLVVLAVGAIVGCGHSGYKKTSTGMLYDISSDGKGELLKNGDFIKVKLVVTTLGSDGKDSVMTTFNDHLPAYGKVDSSMKNQHNFTDLFTILRVGDSASFVTFGDTLKRMGQIPPTANIKPGATFKGWIKILQKFKTEDELKEDVKKEEKTEGDKEVADLQTYLKGKNITAQKTANGVFVVVEKQGDGPAVEKGKMVKVMYTGKNLEGKTFDSNMDSAFGHKDPFSFQVGSMQVIPGWDEGLLLFKQGGKGKMYIPAMLGYKNQAQGPVLKPYTNLIFDVEVLEVKDAPPPAAANAPQMPGQPQR